jgi:curved DNA-binding protein CbpA
MAVGSTPLDPYGALSVPHDASPATIRSSYKKLMLQCHPDKVRDEAQRAEKAQQYQKVQEAYELLIDSRRRRKYDEELARNPHGGTAAASAAAPSPSAPADETKREKHRDTHERRRRRPQEETTFNEADREAAGGTARQTRYKAEEIRRHDQQREREREREQREREREREQREREQREREREREHHRREEVPKHSRERRTHGSTSGRYAEQSPLKPSSYEQPSHVPHVPHVQHPHAQHVPRTPHAPHNPHTPHASHTPHTPHAPQASHPPPGSRAAPLPSQAEPEPATAIRPGYAETIAAEEAKLEAVRRRTREAQGLPTGSPRTQRSNSHDSDANGKAQAHAAMADHTRLAQQQQAEEQQRRERERRERKARKQADHAQDFLAERMGRSTDIPIPRSRKFSVSPSGGSRRRGSSSVCKDDFLGATPPHSAKPPLFSGSVPTTAPFYGSPPHVGGPGYPHLRRRHSVSSPSLEKQTSRSHRQSQPPPPPQQQDSGYSSPSSPNDASTPITFEKKSNLNPGG